jgi:hypothetical protein
MKKFATLAVMLSLVALNNAAIAAGPKATPLDPSKIF